MNLVDCGYNWGGGGLIKTRCRPKSIYKAEGVLYPENDDAMTSYIFSY